MAARRSCTTARSSVRTSSTGYGYTLGKTIAFGYLPTELAGETGFGIEAFGKAYAATRGPRVLYDPKMEG